MGKQQNLYSLDLLITFSDPGRQYGHEIVQVVRHALHQFVIRNVTMLAAHQLFKSRRRRLEDGTGVGFEVAERFDTTSVVGLGVGWLRRPLVFLHALCRMKKCFSCHCHEMRYFFDIFRRSRFGP